MRNLSDKHLAELRASGLDDRTIEGSGIYTEFSPKEIRRILNWKISPDSGGMVVPFRSPQTGDFDGFARVKLDTPRIKDGKAAKYEQPKGAASRLYVPKVTFDARGDAARELLICEGEKKTIALCQCGYATIGLVGVWNAFKKLEVTNKKDVTAVRELLADFDAFTLTDRRVAVLFDTDDRQNPSVEQAACELMRSLASRGAEPLRIKFPLGPPDDRGIPQKMGADDYLVAFGEQSLRTVVDAQLNPSAVFTRSLDDYRSDMRQARIDSLSRPGIYLDTSPTGSGKSTADAAAIALVKSSLTVLPTHDQCMECVMSYKKSGIVRAETYPPLNEKTCRRFGGEAEKVLKHGLHVPSVLCPKCEYRVDCVYIEGMKAAEQSYHSVATHARAAYSMGKISEGKRYITIHEDLAGVLRPIATVNTGLEKVVKLARHARWKHFLEPGDGHYYLHLLEKVAAQLGQWLRSEPGTRRLDVSSVAAAPLKSIPANIELRLFETMKAEGIWPDGDVMRICRGLADGKIDELAIRVDRRVDPRTGEETAHREIVASWKADLPEGAVTWLSDATAVPIDVERIVGRTVCNMTPDGKLAELHAALQVPSDILQSTSPSIVLSVLRAVLAARPDWKRVGVITHRRHVSTIDGTARKGPTLEPGFRDRIQHVNYYRGTRSRGSNLWHQDCDALILLGTPRVRPEVVRNHLLKLGNVAAAGRDDAWAGWGKDYWLGEYANGELATIRTLGYRDHDWRAAHRALVQSELKQALGRARSLNADGIPAIVVTTENLGLKLVKLEQERLSSQLLGLLEWGVRRSDMFSSRFQGSI